MLRRVTDGSTVEIGHRWMYCRDRATDGCCLLLQIQNFFCRRDFAIGASSKNKAGNVIGSSIFKLDELIGAFGTQLQLPLRWFVQLIWIFFYTQVHVEIARSKCQWIFSTKTSVTTSSIGQPQGISQESYCGWILVSARLPQKAAPVILQFSGKNLERKDKFFDETSVFFVVNALWVNKSLILGIIPVEICFHNSWGLRNFTEMIWYDMDCFGKLVGL